VIETRASWFATGDLPGAISQLIDDKPLLKVRATEDEIRFDPASWLIRRKFRATSFGKKLDHLSFTIAGWHHRPYTDEEWAHLEGLYDWGNREGETSLRPRREKGIDVLEWPIVMKLADQKFPEAFALLARVLGPKTQRISVNAFSQLKKAALRQLLVAQREAGKVDPDLEAVTHWSM
jgi:hypothetical protein